MSADVITPWSRGPWTVSIRPVAGYYPLHDANGGLIDLIRGSRFTCRRDDVQVANIRLMALAPQMAAAILSIEHGASLQLDLATMKILHLVNDGFRELAQ